MTEVIIDLTQYKDRVGSLVPDGTYRVLVDDASLEKASTGNMMIVLSLIIADGPNEGATVIDRLTQTPGALFRTVGFMQALGFPTPKKKLKLNLRQFIGKQLMVELEEGEPYQGRTKSEVRGYAPVATGNSTANEADIEDVASADVSSGANTGKEGNAPVSDEPSASEPVSTEEAAEQVAAADDGDSVDLADLVDL